MSILVPDLRDQLPRRSITSPLNWQRTGAAFVSAGAVLLAGLVIALSLDVGPQARHMGYHILAMNIIAPLVAGIAVGWRGDIRDTKASWLWIATITQIAAVWLSHAPSAQAAAMASLGFQLAMHGMLLATAIWFWASVLSLSDAQRWQALPALLLTGKLVCLLAVLLIFAPRELYDAHHHHAVRTLDDQHLAGLLMVVACPLSYLVAAFVIVVQLLKNARQESSVSVGQSAHGAG